MNKSAAAFLLGVVCWGCSGGGDFPVAKTTGTVTCGGQPVPHVLVMFTPVRKGKEAYSGKTGHAYANEQGEFAVSTYGNGDGAVIGNHGVKVDGPSREDHPDFQCDCQLGGGVDVAQVEVTKGGENHFEIVLRKMNDQERRRREQEVAEELEDLE
ncbi:MAG: hypothetical protein KDA80_19005 [Planctomycetaceae bacterium]|nr:hypothetical protein [Planctomycetaceae bacterium]